MITRKDKIDFVWANFKFKSGIRKRHIEAMTDDWLDSHIERASLTVEEWLEQKKWDKYYVSGMTTEHGKYTECVWEVKAKSEEHAIETLKAEGVKVFYAVPTKGHHICKYCKGIAKGTDKDLLCDDCRVSFGHTFYSEL